MGREAAGFGIALVLLLASPSACRSDRPPEGSRAPGYTECGEPRPEMCIQEYRPVCGLRDTGVRCVTAPCEGAWEEETFSNGCVACSHADVHGWRPGPCEEAARGDG